jgi:hypothetical protein
MTRSGWKALLIASLVGGAAAVGLVVATAEPDTAWILALLVSVPFIILARQSWARVRKER